MTYSNSVFTGDLIRFITNSPTSFHAVQNISDLFTRLDFTELVEHEQWDLLPGGSYFVKRNSSCIIVFTLSDHEPQSGFRMAGAHTDSPCLKIKPNPAQISHGYLQIGVESYGGSLLTTWFDRDLSVAGRVTCSDAKNNIHSLLIDFKKPIGIIPSLAIHLDREANEKKSVNKQTDLVPIISQKEENEQPDFHRIISKQITDQYDHIQSPEILDHELFFYDSQAAAHVGLNDEFITGARLDNLLSCYTLVRSLTESETKQNALIVLNDHEETGSTSTSGAQGNFLHSVLERIIPDPESRQRALNRSVFISADNAHGIHPNFTDRFDKGHQPLLNKGPVIKFNANQRYATNSLTSTFFRVMCNRAGSPVQEFVMRSDLACGSTIGPLTAAQTGVPTVDVGVPSFAMHSVRETVGSKDAFYLFKVCKTYFSCPPDDSIWQVFSS